MKKKILIIITIIFLCLFIYSLIQIIFWYKENNHTKVLIQEIDDSIYVNTDTEEEQIDFKKLRTKNPNTIGWINVKGTNIDYPFVKYTNNKYYLTHSFDNKYLTRLGKGSRFYFENA